jgi:hypothetical protein
MQKRGSEKSSDVIYRGGIDKNRTKETQGEHQQKRRN